MAKAKIKQLTLHPSLPHNKPQHKQHVKYGVELKRELAQSTERYLGNVVLCTGQHSGVFSLVFGRLLAWQNSSDSLFTQNQKCSLIPAWSYFKHLGWGFPKAQVRGKAPGFLQHCNPTGPSMTAPLPLRGDGPFLVLVVGYNPPLWEPLLERTVMSQQAFTC